MNRPKLLLTVGAIATAALVLAATVSGETTGDDVIVSGAKAVLTKDARPSAELEAVAAGVAPHSVAMYADAGSLFTLTGAPPDLLSLANQAQPHVSAAYADANLHQVLANVPGELAALASSVVERVRYSYADAGQASVMTYPAAFFNDKIAPVIRDVRTAGAGPGAANVFWSTDEYADGRVEFGTTPGVYTHSVWDRLYYKAHGLKLTGLSPDTTYYFAISSTDRSGNTARSGEFALTVSSRVYLPLILNRRG